MSEDIRQRFINEVKIRAFDDKYVDRAEETDILKIAISMSVDIDTARLALSQVCRMEGYALERELIDEVTTQLRACAGNDGKVDEGEFNLVVATVTQKLSHCPEMRPLKIKRLVVEQMEKMGVTVKTGFFSNWYAKTKKEVGLA
jgi:hypothetical protein